MCSPKSVYSILHSPGPTLAVLFETSNLSHWLFEYVGIMLVCGRRLLGQVGSGLLGAALVDPLKDQLRSFAARPSPSLSPGPMLMPPGPSEA